MWDIDNPDEITLPSFNPNEVSDVRCITCVKDRLWVGAGQSIFFLNAENPNIREVRQVIRLLVSAFVVVVVVVCQLVNDGSDVRLKMCIRLSRHDW